MLYLLLAFKTGHVSAILLGCLMANIRNSQIEVETANCDIGLYNYVSRNGTCHFSLQKIPFRNNTMAYFNTRNVHSGFVVDKRFTLKKKQK